MFRKILVANRGEIALRVIRTCKEMGIQTVAVYSDADKTSLHVRYADETLHIGSHLARKSYLNIEKIIESAKKTRSEAVHPGYGFLAENASFAEACEENDIKFIGPSAKTHRLTGEKITSRRIAAEAGIPVTPGSDGAISNPDEALDAVKDMGYPVIVKASGGGGGRGMKIVHHDDELSEVLGIARGEAIAAFKNPDLYIEKYVKEPHHIEFQILGDESGRYVHLYERECSIQKRYQKLVEESPSPFLDDELREKMADASIRVMRSVGYVNAGTVEFLVDENRDFYFNEINSRLQVEHPVTEMVTGIDLVREQIIIAAEGEMTLDQDDVHQDGWAIECRINAEDPDNGFMPSPGMVEQLIIPGGFGVRLDMNLYQNYEIPPFYDSLVGKLIVWGKDRPTAIARMKRALEEFSINGVKTTIPFHRQIMEDADFIKGNTNTHFIERFEKARS